MPEQHDLALLYHLLVTAKDDELRELLEGTPAARFIGKDGGKFLESVQSVTIQHLSALKHLAAQTEGTPVSVRRWVREGQGVLWLPYRATEIATLRSAISAWMRLAIIEMLSAPEDAQRMWFMVDELDALGAIDSLKEALTRLRKFGVRCVLGLQSIAQARGSYGDADAQSIMENCANTLILRCSAGERGGTAEFASRLIGKREIIRHQHTSTKQPFRLLKTHSVTEQIAIEDAVLASEIEQLPDLQGYLKIASRPEWRRIRLTAGERTAQ